MQSSIFALEPRHLGRHLQTRQSEVAAGRVASFHSLPLNLLGFKDELSSLWPYLAVNYQKFTVLWLPKATLSSAVWTFLSPNGERLLSLSGEIIITEKAFFFNLSCPSLLSY